MTLGQEWMRTTLKSQKGNDGEPAAVWAQNRKGARLSATLWKCENLTLANTKMYPPHFLLDALTDSITSGTFIDTKFYVFSHRDASGRVGSPRPLYCNSRVLKTVPYFSTRE